MTKGNVERWDVDCREMILEVAQVQLHEVLEVIRSNPAAQRVGVILRRVPRKAELQKPIALFL